MVLACVVWFLLPESTRWLIASGKYDEAKEMIEKAAVVNKVKLFPDVLSSKDSANKEEKEDDSGMLSLELKTSSESLNSRSPW